MGLGLPKSRVVRERSPNGEVHLILLESRFEGNRESSEYLDEVQIREIMKKEAGKPLLLLREE